MIPKLDSKAKLLNTAIEMIGASSYGSVSVDDMCVHAGVKKGSFYHAFKSKSDLAVAAFEKFWEDKRPLMESIFFADAPAIDRLNRYVDLIVKDQSEKYRATGKILGCPFCSVGSELSTQDENIRRKIEEMSERSIGFLKGLINDLAQAGDIECSDVKLMAEEVLYYLNGTLVQAKIENSLEPLNRMRHGVHRLLGLKKLSIVEAA